MLTTILTVAEFLAMVCYSPASFSYADELEHWRGTVNILQTGRPFTANYLLPISCTIPAWKRSPRLWSPSQGSQSSRPD